ncbi:Integrase [Bartonella apihabitans]
MFLGHAILTGLLLLFLQNLEAIEKHFATARAPHLIEHLLDNGSCYTALETRQFAVALNLKPSFTPVKCPQSNGISEAFVKTLKRDYIKIANFPDSKSALRQINGWIEDYMKSIHIPRSI